MGTGLLEFYRNRVKRSWKLAFLAAFITGFLVHIYKFTNTLYIRDSPLNVYTSQNIVGSGRWFLSIACGFSSWFDLPWVNGLFSLALIALTAAVVVEATAPTDARRSAAWVAAARAVATARRNRLPDRMARTVWAAAAAAAAALAGMSLSAVEAATASS